MIDGLKGLPSPKGTVIFVCGKCKRDSLPVAAFGADAQKRLVHLLVCPNCLWILGEWPSLQEKEADLQEFAAKVEALNKPKAP
jgi:hypothetical protein